MIDTLLYNLKEFVRTRTNFNEKRGTFKIKKFFKHGHNMIA